MSNCAPSVEASTKIISFLADSEREVGISEISRGTEINKNMVFRILNTLENEGWVYCREQKYSLTLSLFGLASKVHIWEFLRKIKFCIYSILTV